MQFNEMMLLLKTKKSNETVEKVWNYAMEKKERFKKFEFLKKNKLIC